MKRTGRQLPLLILAASLILSGSIRMAGAATLRVPADYETIQEGIDAASTGDTVLVSDGTYAGLGNRDLDFGGVELVLTSVNGPETTILDCEGTPDAPHRGFFFHSGESNAAVVEGLTIRSGLARHADGGAIYVDGASPTLRRCVIESSLAYDFFQDGGGIFLRASAARIEKCTITGNWATYGAGIAIRGGSSPSIVGCAIVQNTGGYGGGIDTGNTSSPMIIDCILAGNDATNGFEDPGSGGGALLGGEATVENCLVTGNISGFGAGVASWGGTPQVVSSTIAGNDAGAFYGGGVTAQNGTLDLERTILWGNCGAVGEQFYVNSGGTISFGCSVYDSSGTVEGGGQVVDLGGNLTTDPFLCDPASCNEAPTTGGDYTIRRDSPCVPENNPCGVWIGARGVGCPAALIEEPAAVEVTPYLGPVRPNPVRSRLDFTLMLPRAGHLRVEIVDVTGRRVAVWIDREMGAGEYPESFDRSFGCSDRLSAGVYLLRLEALGRTEARRFIVID